MKALVIYFIYFALVSALALAVSKASVLALVLVETLVLSVFTLILASSLAPSTFSLVSSLALSPNFN